MDGPYTTLTVAEYNHLATTIIELRTLLQDVRQLLERGLTEEALGKVRAEER
jgi:hypothetical protein